MPGYLDTPPDLDFGDDPVEDYESFETAVKGEGLEFSTELPPGAGKVDWNQIRAAIAEHRVRKGRNPDGSKALKNRIDTGEPMVEVETWGEAVPLAELPTSPKGIYRRAEAAGWRVAAQRSKAHHAATLFQADSEEGAAETDRHERGDVRYPAEDRSHWGVHAVLTSDAGVLGFKLFYETRPKSDSKVATAFSAAWCFDPVNRLIFCRKAGEFETWFDIVVPPAEPKKPRKSKDELLIEGDDWNG